MFVPIAATCSLNLDRFRTAIIHCRARNAVARMWNGRCRRVPVLEALPRAPAHADPTEVLAEDNGLLTGCQCGLLESHQRLLVAFLSGEPFHVWLDQEVYRFLKKLDNSSKAGLSRGQ